jgi:hypothetical protein
MRGIMLKEYAVDGPRGLERVSEYVASLQHDSPMTQVDQGDKGSVFKAKQGSGQRPSRHHSQLSCTYLTSSGENCLLITTINDGLEGQLRSSRDSWCASSET